MSLEKLAEISCLYGANPEYVIAGGGNTSFKDNEFLYIKASGTSLAHAKPADFVKMDRRALAAIWEKNYPSGTDAREAAVLADMMAARCTGEEAKRPSVETLLHDLLPFAYVVHTHPSLVNGLTCSQYGEKAMNELFPGAFWIPLVNPGYILSKVVRDTLYAAKTDQTRAENKLVIFLQNHGVFVAANSTEEIIETYKNIMGTLNLKISQKPDFGNETDKYESSELAAKELAGFYKKTYPEKNWFVRFIRNNQIAAFTADAASFAPVSSAFSPDHIVYSGSDPLFINEIPELEKAFSAHVKKTGLIPKIIAVKSLGIFGVGNSENAAENAVELFRDTVRITVYAENFGGRLFMNKQMIDFINNWEVERYRSGLIK